MSDMASLFSVFAAIPVLLGGLFFYAHQRTYGNLDVTTSSVAYDRTRYHDLLDWDKYSLTIEGEPTQIHSGEFHYWRIPDRERWRPILKQYRSSGFNTIRIYFHWGFHSPDEGIYHFDGNRDVEYLLELCEELDLFVLAAPGPYICAETQAGGYPPWLIAKRDLRIRHNYIMLWRVYDAEFAAYEVQWLENILPIIARHQITAGKKGCVLALQLENELFETLKGLLPVGLHDQMRVLMKAARDLGITVPLFTNDGFEEGGWVPRPELDGKKKSFWQKEKFGVDLYGFDKYVIFPPASSPKSWLIDSGASVGDWQEWNPKNVEHSMDNLEKKVRSFGGGAKKSPIFIPELQGGWFNHYQLEHTYDQIFNFFGEDYTKLIYETTLAQGSTMASLYIPYGGTNWGSLGDPDVYTSYDYSACIREFGMISSRGRNLRKTMLLTRSFDPYFTKTERVTHPNVHSSQSHTINLQRVAIANDQDVLFTFFRNFDRKKRETFDVTVEAKGSNYTVGCYLPYKSSFIAIGNYTTKNDLHLVMSTIPILTRVINDQSNDEVWIVETNTVGAMIFEEKEFTMIGNMQDDNIRHDGASAILSFERTSGWAQLKTATGSLYIIGLAKEEASTLFAEFKEPYWNNGVKKSPALVAWGADTFFYNKTSRQLEIEYRTSNTAARILSFSRLSDPRITSTVGVYDLPFIQTLELPKHAQTPSIYLTLDKWEKRVTQFDQLPWAPLKSFKKNGAVSFDAIDYQYTSGHILYRNAFTTPASQTKVTLSLNIRHRATVILNGQVIGGHTTYSRQLFNAGAKIGPDPWFIGTQKYDLTPYLSNASNQLVILVDSFGLSRQAFIMNDVRNPKGITGVSISGLDSNKHFKDTWEITGVDVRKLDIPYSSTGFPDEEATEGWAPSDIEQANQYTVPISVAQGVQWFKCQFDDQHKKPNQRVPLRLHFDGEWTAMAFLNDVFIARYYGNGDGPQHDFYLPDELVKPTGNQIKILAYTWKDTQGQVSVEGWPVLPDTGNLVTVYPQNEKPEEFMVYKDGIHL